MKEQEAEAWVERLTRVWAPDKQIIRTWDSRIPCGWRLSYVGNIELRLEIIPSVSFNVVHKGTVFTLVGVGTEGTRAVVTGTLAYDFSRGQIFQSGEGTKSFDQFAAQWMPFFRRGCWLSSAPIEASTHEKAEWIQGFTSEEIEAWNLKM